MFTNLHKLIACSTGRQAKIERQTVLSKFKRSFLKNPYDFNFKRLIILLE